MRDFFFVGFILLLMAAACWRPFMMTMAYVYVDMVQPHRLAYYLLSAVPTSMIVGAAALLFYLAFEKKSFRLGVVQGLLALYLIWITITTINAEVPDAAWFKFDTVWKMIAFGIFIPFVVRTRQRINAFVLFIVLCVGTITIGGGIKTLLGGGGYGTLSLFVDNNSGLYEGSTLSTVAVALIPLIVYSYKHNGLFPPSRLTWLIAAGLIFAALLIPIGTEARTGVVCMVVLAGFGFLHAKRKLLITMAAALVALIALPLLPQSFVERTSTIGTYQSDASAAGRIGVWKWTLDYVKDHPLGGGFGVFRINSFEIEVIEQIGSSNNSGASTQTINVRGKAFHSAYFEVLGEHGYPGLALYLMILGSTLWQLRKVRKQELRSPDGEKWRADLAQALTLFLLCFAAGSAFVGIASESILYLMLGLAVSLVQYRQPNAVGYKPGIRTQPFAAARA
jgi:probable O-glycosylation ligase (exosortase A-associated)